MQLRGLEAHLRARTTREPSICLLSLPCDAEALEEIRKREREGGIEVDGAIDAFMQAEATNSGVSTEFMLRILGLGPCADTMVGSGHYVSCCKFVRIRALPRSQSALALPTGFRNPQQKAFIAGW